jgi:transglutaminase superfamily protein
MARPSIRLLRLLVTVALAQVTIGIALRIVTPAVLRLRIARVRSFAQFLVGNASPPDVVRVVQATGRRLPAISTCLVRAFVAELLLASAARPLRLTIGVKQAPDGRLESHAWVTDHDSVLIGAPCEEFVPIVEWSSV